MEYFLKSERIGFRRWLKKDFDIAYKLWGDEEVTKYIGGPFSKEEIRQRLIAEIERDEQFHVQYWPIFLLNTRENIGCCGLRPYDLSKHIYEIGVHIRPQFWRQGFALEASKAVINYSFSALNADALFAGHNPTNKGSKNLLLKLGFKFTHKEFYSPTGLEHPSYLLRK